jgi:hypothetical protein
VGVVNDMEIYMNIPYSFPSIEIKPANCTFSFGHVPGSPEVEALACGLVISPKGSHTVAQSSSKPELFY